MSKPKTGVSLPMVVIDNQTQLKHTVYEITDLSTSRWYWIKNDQGEAKAYEASRFSILS